MNKNIFFLVVISLLAVGCSKNTSIESNKAVVPATTKTESAPPAVVVPAVLEFKTESQDPAYAGSSTVWEPTALTNKQLKRAKAQYDTQQPGYETRTNAIIELEFTPEGGRMFAQLTKENVGKRIAIYINGELVSAPTVQAPILDGVAVIVGDYTPEHAESLAAQLNASVAK